ncbi:MAG: hypothetical protein AAF722_06705 [Cyanobacteria bacterium P01_C01_bin.70]
MIEEARSFSNDLESYVEAWLAGETPDQLPEKLIPPGVDTKEFKDFRLVRPEDISADEQWAIRPAEAINLNATRGFFPDPQATYIVLPTLFAPFGSQVIIEGEFPHARFFDIQMTPSFHPEAYRYRGFGVGEVPIVDADIEPLPGNINPFRVGADRTALNRRYQVTFDLKIGNPVDLNSAFRPPYYRAAGNRRVGGAIGYQGPWGENETWGHGLGVWDVGQIWIRYYAPDKAQGSLGGVPLPKVYYQLPDGRKYYIQADFRDWAERSNRRVAANWTWPEDPTGFSGAAQGWLKKFGILRAITTGMALEVPWLNLDQRYVRDLDRGVAGRGEEMPPPGNFSVAATECNYIHYLLRGMSLGWGKVAILTGKLPTTPRTRDGEPTMANAEARYWSITATDPALPKSDGFVGAALHSVMDDEVVTDPEQNYVIVFSRPEDRPANAISENGVTWVNWGPTAKVSWTLRWLTVHPEWDSAMAPNDQKLGWEGDWASRAYNPSLISNNSHDGLLGEYLPQVHYMGTAEFERLGTATRANQIPKWQ